ncbi:hypothetical protein SAMN04487981_118119 [Streptomyces sp. cf386]|uniref:hypothetical protein n=1 Tax=Streptomyces sp. cf386 TaxID=1761904 RepID=UPI0008849C74|nr:hypothetical protein [Streptomyces sp. cf386]SDP22628.1 hypothetical protein SAMN04487981_118119 [Streptomyces sp. cf386]
MRVSTALAGFTAAAGLIGLTAVPASAAPYDDCRGLQLVCVFEHPDHGGLAVWTGAEDGTYRINYRTRTTGSNVVNSSSSFAHIKAYSGGKSCYVYPGREANLPGGINDNIGQIVITNWNGGLPAC